MDVRTAYCSACDREIRVVAAPGVEPDAVIPADPHELVCLEFGEACTGDMCPLFSVPTREMKEKYDRIRSLELHEPGDPL